MAFPFDGAPRNFKAKKITSALKAPAVKRAVSKISNVIRKQSEIKRKPRRKVSFEPLEPRLLLSADFVLGSSPNDLTVHFDRDGSGVQTVQLFDENGLVSSQAYPADETITITGTSGADVFDFNITADDNFVVTNELSISLDTGAGNDQITVDQADFGLGGLGDQINLTIDGGTGSDTTSLDTSVALEGGDLTVNSETITATASAFIDTSGAINLNATASDTTGSGNSASAATSVDIASGATIQGGNISIVADSTVNVSDTSIVSSWSTDVDATINIQGAVDASSNLVITAAATQSADLGFSVLAAFDDLTSESDAKITVGGSAVLEAASLNMSATTDGTLSGDVNNVLIGTLGFTVDNETLVDIDGGATVDITGTANVSASDTTNIDTTIDTLLSGVPTALDAAVAQADVTRVTKVLIGDTSTTSSFDSTGNTNVSATNAGSVSSLVNSTFVGAAINNVDDTTEVSVTDTDMTVGGLSLQALSDVDLTAEGITVGNDLIGDTKATLNGGIISAGSGGVNIDATESSDLRATAADLSLNVDDYVAPISFSATAAINTIDRNVEASINDGADVTATGGNIEVDANRNTTAGSEVEASALTTAETDINGFNNPVSLGGTIAANVILGDITALIDSSTVETVTSGDINVLASDNALVDADSDLSTVTDSDVMASDLSSGSGGASIAFNSIGVDIDPLSETINVLTGMDFSATPGADVVAKILDSTTTSIDGVKVLAESMAQINATVSNISQTTASGTYGAAGMSASGTLATNKVDSSATASIESSTSVTADVDVSAGADVVIEATDASGIYSNTKLTSTSVTGNSGGQNVFNEALGGAFSPDHQSTDGSTLINFGDKVQLDENYDVTQGNGGSVYEYLGTTDTLDLSDTDYTDLGLWKEVTETSIAPEGLNTSNSDSVSVGGQIVRNDVNASVEAKLDNIRINALGVDIDASETATIESILDSTVTSSGGSAYGTGTSLAINGAIATNAVNSTAKALIDSSEVVAGANGVAVNGANTAELTADASALTSTGDTAFSFVIAFNTIGWDNQGGDILDAAATLLNTDFAVSTPASVDAIISDSNVTSGAGVTVDADSNVSLSATNSNTSDSAASALYGATGMAATGLLASNMVNSEATAKIISSDGTHTVNASGDVDVLAADNASIDAGTVMEALSSTTNDAGSSLVNTFANSLINDYDYTTNSGLQNVDPDEMVRLDDSYSNGGVPGQVYRFTGNATTPLTLGTINYDLGDWELVNVNNILPESLNYSGSDSIAVGGMIVRNDVRSEVESFIDSMTVNVTGGDVTVDATEAAQLASDASGTASSGGGSAYGTGESIAVNFNIITNNLQSDAEAYIVDSTIDADESASVGGSVNVNADNAAMLDARADAFMGTGDTGVAGTLAFNTIGYNTQDLFTSIIDTVLTTDIGTADPSQASAYILDTTVNAENDLLITAESAEQLNSTVSNAAESAASALFGASGKSASVLLASNMVASEANAYVDFSDARGTLTVGGVLQAFAEDNSAIYANNKIVSSSITTNDGGASLFDTAFSAAAEYDNTSDNTAAYLQFGDKVLATDSVAANNGEAGQVYEYMGVFDGNPIDLSTTDFNDLDFWKLSPVTDAVPQGNNITSSESNTLGVVLARNDVRSDVNSFIDNATVNSGSVDIDAVQNALIDATVDSYAESSGGNILGDGESNAYNGTIATNLILGDTTAKITDSEITTTNNIDVNALNTQTITAINDSSTLSGDTAGAATLAFNTIGWESQNILFNALEALIGSSEISEALGNDSPAAAYAYILNSEIDASGDLTVEADANADMEASVSNAATSNAAAFYDATGMAIGGILASNMVNSEAKAYVDILEYNTTSSDTSLLFNGLRVLVESGQNAGGNVDSVYEFIGTNLSIIPTDLSTVDYTDAAWREVNYPTNAGEIDAADVTISADNQSTMDSTTTLLASSSTSNQGGANLLDELVDTLIQDYQYTTESGTWDIEEGDKVRLGDSYLGGGAQGTVYIYEGDGASYDLGATDFASDTDWTPVTASNVIPDLNLTGSDSIAVGGLVVRNDVRGEVEAFIRDHIVTATGDVLVEAIESAEMLAYAESVAESSGGSAYGTGESIAVNGQIVTNLVQSQADAYIIDSTVTANETADPSPTGGNVTVDAQNSAAIDATLRTATTTGDTAVGVMLAFNTIGYESENIITQTIDTLLNTDIGSELPSQVNAYILDSTVDADADINVNAVTAEKLNATVTNAATSAASALYGATGQAASLVLASNMVSSSAEAFIDFTSARGTTTAGGTVDIDATDISEIYSNSKLTTSSITTNDGGVGVVNGLIREFLDFDHISQEGPTQLEFGAVVKLADDYDSALGEAGSFYEFMGDDTVVARDLSSEDYNDLEFWKKLETTDLVPQGNNLSPSDSNAVACYLFATIRAVM